MISKAQKTIFIFAYYSYKDPVFQSALLPYFIDFPEKEKFHFVILTFEQKKFKMTKEQEENIKDYLKQHNITWYKTIWRSGKLKIVKKFIDVVWGILFSAYLIVKYKPIGIYAEGINSAMFSYHLSKIFNLPLMAHSFEPHSDYMLEGGVWSSNDWETKVAKSYENKIAHYATYIFTATTQMVERINQNKSKTKAVRVPSCVDLNLFKFSETDRNRIRSQFDLVAKDILITYLGKLGGMYLENEIFEMAQIFLEKKDNSFHFLIITQDDHKLLWEKVTKFGIPKDRIRIIKLEREEVPAYLSASDFGLVAVKQSPSRKFSSPIKDGEYWACGLPLLIFKGVSDDYLFCEANKIGIVIQDTSKSSFNEAYNQVVEWVKVEDKIQVRERCINFVKKDRDVKNYKELYKEAFLSLPPKNFKG